MHLAIQSEKKSATYLSEQKLFFFLIKINGYFPFSQNSFWSLKESHDGRQVTGCFEKIESPKKQKNYILDHQLIIDVQNTFVLWQFAECVKVQVIN